MKRALLVGIDSYDTLQPQLSGCVNDVEALAPLFSHNEDNSSNFQVVTLTTKNSRVDRASLIKEVRKVLSPGADFAVLYFAGHGDKGASDVDLCTQDGSSNEMGVAFSWVLGLIKASPVPQIIVILDCCFSGAAGGIPAIGGDLSFLRPGVSILTASRSNEPAAEIPSGRGSFSFFLEGALEGGAADVLGGVTVADAYSYLRQSFGAGEQGPTFKSNLDTLQELRRCDPAVPLEEMRRLTEFFPQSRYIFPLDPSYEPTEKPEHPEHEIIFLILQHFRAAKLLVPIDEEHLYYAALNSKACKLTPMGQHYWYLVSKGRL